MKKKLILCSFLILSSLSAQAKITPSVIYGNDDRMDVYESSDALMKVLSASTAAQILNNKLTLKDNIYTLSAGTLEDEGICKSERFSNQLYASECSGFLISEDTLVTAGHCINSVNDCSNHSWVFDFSNISALQTSFTFTKDQVFKCTEIIAIEKNNGELSDYAVLKLDRPVPGRAPLKYRTSGKVDNGAILTVIGHPSALPTKITSNAEINYNLNPVFFITNADTYGGNSGSAVIDSKTGMVEGILVRGEQDYTPSDPSDMSSCLVSVHREQRDGGEHATRITNIKIPQKN